MSAEPASPVLLARTPPSRAESLRGILFMSMGFFLYSVADMLAKILTQSIHPVQVAWVRQLGLLAGVLVLLTLHGTVVLRSRHPVLQVWRGLTVVAASTSFVFAVTYVPLADAVAVSFVAPFIVTVLGALVLRETVGIRRGMAVVLGFVGTLVVIRPGVGVFHPAIFLVLIAAAAFAIRQILSRFLSGGDGIATTVAYTGLTASIALTIPLPFFWSWPANGTELLLMLVMAGAAGSAEFTIMRALELAEAVVVSPLQYTLMIWSTLWGFLIFAQLPDLWTLAGAAVIVVSGIYTLYREAGMARA